MRPPPAASCPFCAQKLCLQQQQWLEECAIADASCLAFWRRMSRDQRVRDNWALIYAAEAAAKRGVPVAVAFNLVGWLEGAA